MGKRNSKLIQDDIEILKKKTYCKCIQTNHHHRRHHHHHHHHHHHQHHLEIIDLSINADLLVDNRGTQINPDKYMYMYLHNSSMFSRTFPNLQYLKLSGILLNGRKSLQSVSQF